VIYAFSRDGGMPFSNQLKKVQSEHQTPVSAIWTTVGAAFAAAIYSGAYEVVTSISVMCLYFAYIAPVFLSWKNRKKKPLQKGPWHLGPYSSSINLIAIIWTVFITTVVSLANDYKAGKTMVGLILLLSMWYHFRERHRYTGPLWLRDEQPGDKTG